MDAAMDEKALLLRAIQLAEIHSRRGRNGPFGAVVARGGEVLGEGWNEVVRKKDPTAHAEIQAIREATRTLGTHVLADCTIYCSCEPCPMCLAAIYWARIGRVVFAASGEDARAAGFDDTRIGREATLEWEDRALSWNQTLQKEGKAVLDAWARNPQRREY
jgi:tRNA(Arg) A34 adenosine deaminase TadA